eukprot:3172614-Pleurochrysis_carterae.AAC.2
MLHAQASDEKKFAKEGAVAATGGFGHTKEYLGCKRVCFPTGVYEEEWSAMILPLGATAPRMEQGGGKYLQEGRKKSTRQKPRSAIVTQSLGPHARRHVLSQPSAAALPYITCGRTGKDG